MTGLAGTATEFSATISTLLSRKPQITRQSRQQSFRADVHDICQNDSTPTGYQMLDGSTSPGRISLILRHPLLEF
jgi:hypothetical protein